MKKFTLTALSLLTGLLAMAQTTVPNGDFETWTNHSWDNPDSLTTSIGWSFSASAIPNVTRTTDKVSGNYAIRLETVAGTQDTIMGYFIWGQLDETATKGFAYTQQPDTVTGYYKYNILTGDTAIIIALFWKAGAAIAGDTIYITGTQNSFVKFKYPLTVPVAPDSVTFGACSSLPFSKGVAKPGSWMILDSIAFSGPGVTQQLYNKDFELWTSESIETPDEWANLIIQLSSLNISYLEKSTDKYEGSYAMKLTSKMLVSEGDTNYLNVTFIGNDVFNQNNNGFAYTEMIDTLVFRYKYTPVGTDTAKVMVSVKKAGSSILYAEAKLNAAATYTEVKIPIYTVPTTPDTIKIYVMSSVSPSAINVGSMLLIDDLHFQSNMSPTGICKPHIQSAHVSMFPNPATSHVTCSFDAPSAGRANISIFDITGRSVYNSSEYIAQGRYDKFINTGSLSEGVYFYEVRFNDQLISTNKFMKK